MRSSFPNYLRFIHLTFFSLLALTGACASAQSVYESLIVRSPSPTPNHINNLQYGNGKFLGTTDSGGVILSSDDGINWSSHFTGYWGGIDDIAYGNGIYITTTAGSGPAYYSSDLENWTEIPSNQLPSNNDNVYFHDGLFYFGGSQFKNNEGEILTYGITTTADGITLNNVEIPGDNEIADIIFANGQFMSVGRSLEIMTSPDGVNWTVRPTGITLEGNGKNLLAVRYWNSLYVVSGIDGTILTSPDGITWTKRDFAEDNSWFFDSWFDGITYYFPGRSRKLWTTTDFISWTAVQIPGELNDTISHIVNEEGITVVTGRQGMIFTSADQSTWTNQQKGFTASFTNVVYGAGTFVANTYDGIINSGDGVTWATNSPPGLNDSWNNLVFEDGKFVAMTSKGEWSLSPDGKIWSAVTDELEPYPGINALRYLNDKWFVVGNEGFIRSSSSLVKLADWDVHDLGITNDLFDISYGNGVYVAVGRGGVIYSSIDGVNWGLRDGGTIQDLWQVEFGHGKFVLLGNLSTALTSTDGESWSAEGQQGQPGSAGDLVFREGQFIVLYTGGRILYSSDGLSWTTVRTSVSAIMEGSAQSEDTLVVVGRNGLIMSADLPPKKMLTVTIEGQGEVTVSPAGPEYPHLAEVTLIPVPHEDFAFSFWSGDESSDDDPLIIEMDADKTIKANFVLSVSGYRLWVYQYFNEMERGDDEQSGPDVDYDKDGLTNNDEYLLGTHPKEKNGPHTLTMNVAGSGSVALSPPGGGPYTYGTEVTVTATGTAEFAFTGWSGDASGSSNPLVVTMDADKTITAQFSVDLDGFALFRYSEFSAEERVVEAIAGPQSDYDLDGLTNLEEYLLGTNPKVVDIGKGLSMGTVEIGGELYLTITYNRSKDISGVSQTVEVGNNLESWLSGPVYAEAYALNDNVDGTEAVTMRILDPIGSLPSWFARLVLEEK